MGALGSDTHVSWRVRPVDARERFTLLLLATIGLSLLGGGAGRLLLRHIGGVELAVAG